MNVRRGFVLSFILLFSSIATLGQVSKQALNDQLYEAVRKGDLAAATSLLDQGADVNAKFRYGATALFKAAERGNLEIVKLLLARGADVTVKDTFYNGTAMFWALDGDHPDIVAAILDKDPDSAGDVLMTGVREGKTPFVKIALAGGKVKPESLTAALAIAADDKDKTEIVDLLKKAGAVPPPEVAAATLQSYVGNYKDDAGTEVAITLNGGKLAAVVVGQRPFALMALDNSNFRPIAFEGIVLSFKLDAATVTGMELKRGATTTQLKRVVETKP